MKEKAYLFNLILILFLYGEIAHSQVNADFTVDKTSGCSPLVVSFTNNSSGDNLSYSWDFGNGNSSTNADPQATYTTPGTYEVKLTVSNASGSDEISAIITVFKNPVADFLGDDRGCTPFTAQFTDESTPGDAPIQQWKWDFRSGFIDSRQNPSYTYTIEGEYDVFLEVVDENGCSANVEKQGYVDVVRPPSSIFNISPSAACEIPAVLNFSNSSSGSGNLTYNWSFGDENTTSEQSPSHTYTSFGDYVIRLEVSSDYGCSTVTEKLFKVQNVSASGNISQDGKVISSGGNICPGMLDFKTPVAGIPVLWSFGDGTFSSDTAGSHYYGDAGTYNVKLIAAPNEACADTVSWVIHVDEIIADFTFTPEYSCKAPIDVNFTNTSTNAISYEWKFADNSTSTEENPVKTFAIPAEINPYAISSAHILNTELTVKNENGCESSVTKSLTIQKPTAQFKVDTLQGCKPLNVNFTDISQSDQNITKREWIFDDGESTSGTAEEVEHIYTSEGNYNARLVITNADGCTDTSYAITIEVGKEMNPDFQIVPSTFCQNEEIKFSHPGHLNENIDQWHYTIGNTDISLDPSGNDTTWLAKMHETGSLDAKLTVSYNGCISEIIKPDHVTSTGPIAAFSKQMDCNTPFDYTFEGNPQNHTDFIWKFGDGDMNTSDLNTSHTYPSEDDYELQFITINGSCSDTARETIAVRQPGATILSDTAVCAGDSIIFDGKDSYGVVNYCFEKYLWHFQDTTPRVRTNRDTVYHMFNQPGEYNIKLITYYDNHCSDTTSKEITVYQPLVGFETDVTEGCAPIAISFKDTSSANIHPLESWHIDYGDDFDSSYVSGTSEFSHTYYNVGTYPVTLSVTDSFGCTGSFTEVIHTANPSAEFTPLTTTETCAGNPIMFTHYYRESDSVQWNFGDGALSNDTSENISHEYQNSGEFQVSLTVYQYGCTDTFKTDTNFVKIQKADAHFTVNDSFFNCYPEMVEFTHVGTPVNEVAHGSWDFGFKTSTSDYAEKRQFTYPEPGEYTISLYVSTSYGCDDTYDKNITVTGPRGNFTMSSKAICRGDEVTLTLKDTSDVYNFEWDLGDGNFVKGNPVTHRYYEMGDNIPKLILSGDSGRCLPPPVEDTLYVYEIESGFNIENPALCEQSDIIFSNSSTGQTENQWLFSDGTTGNSENYASDFAPGDYSAKLIVSNPQGCKDTSEQAFTIYPLPDIWVMPDTFICRGKPVTVRAVGGNSISWTPSADLTNPNAYESVAEPAFTTSFLAVVTDTSTGCKNQDNVLVTVQQPPEIHVSPEDTSVIIGENVTFTADSLTGVVYQWSPEKFFPCTNCATVNAIPFESTTVTLLVSDDKDCFNIPINIPVEVREEYSVDMPNSFTPNGDGNNDVVYVRGWGIKRLVEFRIINRWGNEVFFTDNLSEGWDGTYNGKLQNIDTYAYIVRVETWEGNFISKKGTITLLK